MASFDRKYLIGGICIALALATLAVYWPITRHDFVSYDDADYITANPYVRDGLSWSGIAWAFKTTHAGNWHPLTWVSHMIDCSWHDVRPAGHHLTSLLLHVVNSLLAFLLLRRLTGMVWRSALVAALFALHPMHVESVAWAAERKDVLSALFWFLTLMAYVKYVGLANLHVWRARIFYGLSLLFFILGLMSKPMVVTLPFVMLLIDFWPLGRLRILRLSALNSNPALASTQKSMGWLICEKLPFFVLTTAGCMVTYFAQRAGGAIWASETLPIGVRLVNALVSYARYLLKAVWPADLAVIYPYQTHWSAAAIGAALLSLVLITGLTLLYLKRNPALFVGWCWFLGTLVPVIGLVQVGSQSMADRYTYLPFIGLFIAVVWGVGDLLNTHVAKKLRATVAVVAAVVIVIGCGVGTRLQIQYWQNGETLFRHALQVTENNYLAYNGLGSALHNLGRKQEALAAYAKSIELHGHFPEAQYNYGTMLMDAGKPNEAIAHFQIALKGNPRFADAYQNLGEALMQQGKMEAAATHLEKAIALKPDNPFARYNLGTVLLRQSQYAPAAAQFAEAVKLKPDFADAHGNLAIALMREGQSEAALPHFSEAARLDPTNPERRFNLGLFLLEHNRPAEAEQQLEEALRLKSETKTHYRLAVALLRQHKTESAVIHYRAALRLAPDFPDALNSLAWILATDPKLHEGQEALHLAQRACELTQDQNPAMLATLAAAQAEVGKFSDAISSGKKAHALATSTGDKQLAERTEAMLKAFRTQQTFRDNP